jgi:hypothetical protein
LVHGPDEKRGFFGRSAGFFFVVTESYSFAPRQRLAY